MSQTIFVGRLTAAAIAIGLSVNLWLYIGRTNTDLARFIDSIRFHDYSQRFPAERGAGFESLGGVFENILHGLRDERSHVLNEVNYLLSVIDDAPVAMLAIAENGTVELLNKAARRLFAVQPVSQASDFAAYGPELEAALDLPPGHRRMTQVVLDGTKHRAIVAMSKIDRPGKTLKLASILPLQSEFGALELTVQADLIRVLTHEIMNSLTPVASLARSCARLVDTAAKKDPGLDKARLGIATLANRAEGILRFVENYRAIASAPDVHCRPFAAKPWLEEIVRFAEADDPDMSLHVTLQVEPPELEVHADPDLLAQVVLNLLRNSGLALETQDQKEVRVTASSKSQGRMVLTVEDNGPGIAPEHRHDAFLPFYTTRVGGSGVGLSLARQIVLAHGGTIEADGSSLGGALIRLVI